MSPATQHQVAAARIEVEQRFLESGETVHLVDVEIEAVAQLRRQLGQRCREFGQLGLNDAIVTPARVRPRGHRNVLQPSIAADQQRHLEICPG